MIKKQPTKKKKAHYDKLHEMQKKPVLRIGAGGTKSYNSMIEAQEDGFFKSNISACISGRLKHYKGYHWELA